MAIEAENFKKLIEHLEQDVTEALKYKIFEANPKRVLINFIDNFLKPLKEQNSIKNYKLDVKLATWEDFYPVLAVRLLAIEALDKFGSTLPNTPENYQMVKGYPYHIETFYRVWREDYKGNAYVAIVEEDELVADEEKEEISSLKINNPENMMLCDIRIRPICPVSMITITNLYENFEI